MTLDQAIQRTYLLAAGKAVMPTAGSTKYVKITSLLNMYKDVWARQSNVAWRSLRATYTVPTTITAGVQQIAIGATLENVSRTEGDFIRVYWSDGVNESDYNLVPIERLHAAGPIRNGFGTDTGNFAKGSCAIVGTNLVFDQVFVTGVPEVGGSIRIPHYPVPADMTTSTDPVPVDDPDWICFMAAAEYVRNDITKQNQYGNLIAQASDSFSAMLERNNSQVEDSIQVWTPLGATW